jgi:ATP-dependent exoDNAse (exonuclease V) alpha subunit
MKVGDCDAESARCSIDKESFLLGKNSGGPRRLVKATWGYAITCHKAQGSEWPRVIVIDDGWQRWVPEDRARWLYTAITRASEKLIIAE